MIIEVKRIETIKTEFNSNKSYKSVQLVAVEFMKLMWKDDEFESHKWSEKKIWRFLKDRIQSEICCNINGIGLLKKNTKKRKNTCWSHLSWFLLS